MWSKFVDRILEWLFRRRPLGRILIGSGLSVLALALSASWALSIQFPFQGGVFSLALNTSDDAATLVTWAAAVFGVVLIVAGVILEMRRERDEASRLERKRAVAIELRGLRQVADAPLSEAVPAAIEGRRDEVLVDLRKWEDRGTITDPGAALQEVALLPHHLNQRYQALDRRDVSVVFGGLAAVPFTFLAGMLVDDESQVTLLDWDRDASRWRALDGADDGDRFALRGIDRVPVDAPAAILTVSVSYKVDVPAVRTTLGDLPLVELDLPNGTPSCHWSEQKQQALAQAFRDTVIALGNRRVGRIHVVIAAQSSVAFRFGRSYDRRNLPPLVVYQYERSSTPPYPWGVAMPTHGLSTAAIVRPLSPAIAPAG